MKITQDLFRPVSYEGLDPQLALQIAQQQANTRMLALGLAEIMNRQRGLGIEERLAKLREIELKNDIRFREANQRLNEWRLRLEARRVAAEASKDAALTRMYDLQLREAENRQKALEKLNSVKVPLPGVGEISLGTVLQVDGLAPLLRQAPHDKVTQRIDKFVELMSRTRSKFPALSYALAFGKQPTEDIMALKFKNELEQLQKNPELIKQFDQSSQAFINNFIKQYSPPSETTQPQKQGKGSKQTGQSKQQQDVFSLTEQEVEQLLKELGE